MPQINFGSREIRCKVVYWGPGLSGKTTNLQVVHKKAPPERRGEMVAIATAGDRTLFFDYLPLDLGEVNGMKVRFQLYTVPGQEYYRATRRLVLQGADGVVFVADSRAEMLEANRAALLDMEECLREHGLDRARVPVVFQWNKRDMPGVLAVDALDRALNDRAAPSFEAVAATGEGVFPTLKCAAGLVLEQLRKDFGIDPRPKSGEEGRRRAPAAAARAPAAREEPAPRPAAKPRPARARRVAPAEPPAELPLPVVEPRLPLPEVAPAAPVRRSWTGVLAFVALAAAGLAAWALLFSRS